jgi:hypothetical protein
MIDFIVRTLFSWGTLRNAIFSEVDLYNSITRIMNDPEQSKIAVALWCESDGWRGWQINDDGSYYFNDVPENSISTIMDLLTTREKESII